MRVTTWTEYSLIISLHLAKRGRTGNRGTGLGLAVSQKIMSEHGGRIRVESQPGEGSRFTLELPAVQPENVSATSGVQTGVSPP